MFDGMKKEGICLLQTLRKQVETKTMTAPEELYKRVYNNPVEFIKEFLGPLQGQLFSYTFSRQAK